MVTTCTEHTKSRIYIYIYIYIFYFFFCINSDLYEHTRSRKCHFLRNVTIQLNPVIMGTTCTEHTKSRKFHFSRRGYLTSTLLFSWLQHVKSLVTSATSRFYLTVIWLCKAPKWCKRQYVAQEAYFFYRKRKWLIKNIVVPKAKM